MTRNSPLKRTPTSSSSRTKPCSLATSPNTARADYINLYLIMGQCRSCYQSNIPKERQEIVVLLSPIPISLAFSEFQIKSHRRRYKYLEPRRFQKKCKQNTLRRKRSLCSHQIIGPLERTCSSKEIPQKEDHAETLNAQPSSAKPNAQSEKYTEGRKLRTR